MGEEILINFTPMETRVALIENGMPQEIYIERDQSRGIVGNIYKGKVVRILPGMQAAFVDIGLSKAAFIHVEQLLSHNASASEKQNAHIAKLVHDGQTLLVQVTKDPIGTKGARLTTHLSLPSRYLVYMPSASHIGVSQRIEDEVERQRLLDLMQQITAQSTDTEQGFILRTIAEGASADELQADVDYLYRLWHSLEQSLAKSTVPAIIYQDLPLSMRVLRDITNVDIERIRIDSKETYQQAVDFVQIFMPEVQTKLEYYPGERPIFDLFSVEEEVQRALGRRVALKSGGYLIFDQAEAMTTIDINTGAFVGRRNLEETIFKTNLEAASAIGRQLRLRNLGGIIIIDFIDMEDEDHQHQVLRALECSVEKDHAKCKITGVSQLGLIEMTRQRTRENLSQILCQSCSECQGRGSLKTPETICYEIFREILRQHRAYDMETYSVLAAEAVVNFMQDEAAEHVEKLQSFIGKQICLQVEPIYAAEQYDVVLR